MGAHAYTVRESRQYVVVPRCVIGEESMTHGGGAVVSKGESPQQGCMCLGVEDTIGGAGGVLRKEPLNGPDSICMIAKLGFFSLFAHKLVELIVIDLYKLRHLFPPYVRSKLGSGSV